MTARFVYFLTLNLAVLVTSEISLADSTALWRNKAGINVSASYADAMNGPLVESVYFDSTALISDRVSMQFRIDPLYSGSSIRQPLRVFSEFQSSSHYVLSQFSLTAKLHDAFSIRLSQSDGTLSPLRSPFVLTEAWSDEAFAQSTVSLLLQHSANTFAVSIGNGEGETTSIDPEMYYGASWLYRSAIGFVALAGWSFDGNNLASEEAKRKGIAYTNGKLGFSTERHYAAIGLDGSWDKALGLKTSLVYQNTVLKDQDAAFTAFPTPLPSSDWRELFVEDPVGKIQNQLQRQRWAFNASYLILARFDVGLGIQKLSVKSDVPLSPSGDMEASAVVSTWGLGVLMEENLHLSLEQFHWSSQDDPLAFNGLSRNSGRFFLLRATATFM